MKKIIFVLTLLLLVAPAMAKVEISCTSDGGEVTVRYDMTAGDANLPRGFGMDITLNNDANIVSVNDFNPDFWVYPGSIDINSTTYAIDSNGSAVASSTDYPGVTLDGPPDSNGMTIEMGSLYVGAPNAPDNNGVLFTFIVDADCNVAIAGNTARGNVVLETAVGDNTLYTGCTVTLGCPTCPGDMNPDGILKLQDLYILRGRLLQAYAISGFYSVPKNDPCSAIAALYDICGEMNPDDELKLQDYYMLRGKLLLAYNDTGFYEANCPCYDAGTCP